MKAKYSKKKSETDWDKLNNMSDEEINYSDIPPLGEDFFKTGQLRLPKAERQNLIQIDTDVLSWFKSYGVEYQVHMNKVLRKYIETHNHKNA